jgi:hypothetical protein
MNAITKTDAITKTKAAPAKKPSAIGLFFSRLATVGALFAHFGGKNRRFMLPLLLFLIMTGVLLVVTGGLSYVAPFVYAIF